MLMQKQQKEQPHPPISYQLYKNNYKHRIKLRNINFNAASQVVQQKPKSAQIKVIQKFIGKLKVDNKNHQSILSQMETVNLSKYIQEISALIALYVSQKEIAFYAQVATKLNQEYQDIPRMILKDIQKQFSNAYDSPQDNKAKIKTLLLFITQLFVCGFAFPYKEISQLLKKLVKVGTKKRTNFTTQRQLRLFAYFYNCDIYAQFLINYGQIFTQSTSTWLTLWQKQGKQIFKYPQMIPVKVKQDITNVFFNSYINSCTGVIQAAFQNIKQLQVELRQNLKLSGEFNKQIQTNYNELKQKFIFTKKNLQIIIRGVNSNIMIKKYQQQLVEVQEIMKKYINKIDNVQIFENQFEKQLYLDLPELCKVQNKNVNDQAYLEFKQKLDKCKNKSDSDDVTKLFQGINNKKTRRMLAKDLLQYRKQYQLVTPFMCRIGAIIALNFKDITEIIVQQLFSDYQKLKDNVNSNFVMNDKKSRNLKYICQFTKFKLIDSDRILNCIQNLIDDLKGYNIQLLISCLENVGRFLYLSPNNANRFTFLLSKLENVMKQKSFPLFTTSQLLNSISLIKPYIGASKVSEKNLTTIQQEAAMVLSKDIISELDEIIEGIDKLIKSKIGLQAVQVCLIEQIEKYDFLRNYNYAYLINQLNNSEITDYVNKKTIQKLQDAIEKGNYQSCILWSRFFGQLYKYQLIKRTYLFQQLNRFISIKNTNQVLVINLICTVLETCQGYLKFKKATANNQKFEFLVNFKLYIHSCFYVPMLQEFKIIDIFQQLEPNMTSVSINVINTFMQQNQDYKNKKQIELSKKFDDYLQKKQIKKNQIAVSNKQEPQLVDPRQETIGKKEKQDQPQKSTQNFINEANFFQNQYVNIMNSNIKDYSGRIAKSAFVEKVIDKKREKKKPQQGEKKITIIARNGTRFAKKQVIYKDDNNEKRETKLDQN